jgi:1,4-dihydroxy-2-naphthoate octaprenyltransferase
MCSMARSKTFWSGFFRLADPKITLASMSSLTLGLGLAVHETRALAWGWFGLAVFGIFWLEVAKNASGEVYDWDSGDDAAVAAQDRSPFSGGKRVLVDGLMARAEVWEVAAWGYGLGVLSGLAIGLGRDTRVLWLGLAGVALAFWYHAPPLRLSYRGLGELAVGVAYGPLICGGAVLVLRGRLSFPAAASAIPLGMMIAAFLLINEFPDRRADAAAGKKTLVVRLGPVRASRAFAALVTLAFLGQAAAPLLGAPRGLWVGLIGLPPALLALRRLSKGPEETALLAPAQGLTLLSFVLIALGSALGLALLA